MIMSWPWGAYLGDEGLKNGHPREDLVLAARRAEHRSRTSSKATGIYLNSMLAVIEANRAGYDEAILLTADGYIADGSGENIFIVKDGDDLHARLSRRRSCPGSRATRSSRSRRTSATRSMRRT